MGRPRFYWFRFRRDGGLPVNLPAMPAGSRWFRWTGLYGIQIGPWFFGAIRGGSAPPLSDASET